MTIPSTSKPSEAEVVWWLKRSLAVDGLNGSVVREILVDADASYLHSRFGKRLEPTGALWIDKWRPDLVCVVETDGAERLAGFEVKSIADHEKGVIQAMRYRAGVHDAYLCIPTHGDSVAPWLRNSVTSHGVGLLTASPTALRIEIPPAGLQPEPRTLQVTRRYLLGEVTARAFSLNKPLHYLAFTFATAFAEEPWKTLRGDWGLQDSALRLAARGAEILGLVSAGTTTHRGKAYADLLRLMGFTLAGCRSLTGTRLATSAPHFAAVLRTVLLQHPAVALIVQVLSRDPSRVFSIEELAQKALGVDEGLARAIFGIPPQSGATWQMKPTTRFQLKAALYDTGLIDTRLARSAGGGTAATNYDPSQDRWQLGITSSLRI